MLNDLTVVETRYRTVPSIRQLTERKETVKNRCNYHDSQSDIQLMIYRHVWFNSVWCSQLRWAGRKSVMYRGEVDKYKTIEWDNHLTYTHSHTGDSEKSPQLSVCSFMTREILHDHTADSTVVTLQISYIILITWQNLWWNCDERLLP